MNAPPRIVHVYKDVYPPVEGGIERIIHLLATRLAGRYDVRVIVASRDRRGRERLADGVPVVEVPCYGRPLSNPLAPGFARALRRSGADLLHFHIPHPTGETAWLLAGPRVPAVATYHSDVVRQRWLMPLYRPIFHRFLNRLACIMPTSARYMETSPFLVDPARRARCRVVALGYPLEDYEATPAALQRAAELRAAYGEFVLFLGCLRRYKGLAHLLEALARLPAVRAVIAGEGPEGPALRARAGRLGVADRIVFTGRVSAPEAVALLHAATLFVLPSDRRSEAFGLCQIEAMACGLPVVSTDLPSGVPEVNRHGETGLIVPPADPAALAAAIGRLLADAPLRARLGEAGRRRAQANYRVEQMAAAVAEVYDAALQRK